MKALVIQGPNRFQMSEIPAPATGPDEVLIDVLAGGICGTDLEILRGNMVYFTNGAASYPVTPCHEWTGVVSAVGRDVRRFSAGDRVVGEVSIGCRRCQDCLAGHYHRCEIRTETGILNRQGGFAEQIALPSSFVHSISGQVPLRSAALVEPAAVAFNGARRAAVSPSDRVAIFGDGPIGLLLLQVMRVFGVARVALIGAADRRLALARALGADSVIDARTENVIERLREVTGGALPSVVFEASGNPEAIETGVAATAPGGRLVLQGLCGGRRVGLNSDSIVVNDLTIHGALGSPGVWPDVIRLIENRRLDPAALVTDELPVSAFGEAIRRVESREAVKIVLRTDSEAAWE